MHRARLVPSLAFGSLLAIAIAACSAGAEPGWTFAPTPTPTIAPSVAPSGSAAPSAPSGSGAPSAGPSGGTGGAVLTEVASGVQFQTTSLQAPANKPFQIAFDNQDASIPHDIEIADGTNKLLFVGDTITGVAQITYNVPGLPAATYKFLCKWHPNMVGELKVQ
jgi:plastocyanin